MLPDAVHHQSTLDSDHDHDYQGLRDLTYLYLMPSLQLSEVVLDSPPYTPAQAFMYETLDKVVNPFSKPV